MYLHRYLVLGKLQYLQAAEAELAPRPQPGSRDLGKGICATCIMWCTYA